MAGRLANSLLKERMNMEGSTSIVVSRSLGGNSSAANGNSNSNNATNTSGSSQNLKSLGFIINDGTGVAMKRVKLEKPDDEQVQTSVFLCGPDGTLGVAMKRIKLEKPDDEHVQTSVFLCGPDGTLVPAEVVSEPIETNVSASSLVTTPENTRTIISSGQNKVGVGNQPIVMRINTLGDIELDNTVLTAAARGQSVIIKDEQSTVISGSQVKKPGLDDLPEEVQLDVRVPANEVEVKNFEINQSWCNTREDKIILKSRGQNWRQGMWSKEEVDLLKRNIESYCQDRGVGDPSSIIFQMSKEERKGFYRVVAQGINRPLFSIYRRVIRMYDQNNHMGRYSEEEVEQLRELRRKHSNNWQAIAAHMGRSAASVKDRCRLLKEHCNKGAWKAEEEDRLAAAVYDLASALPGEQVTAGISWGEVATRVGTRSEKQCRTKWLNYLNWKKNSGVEWCKADDIQLICRLSICGAKEEAQVDWTSLAKGWAACRSPHWLRGKWWSLKRQRFAQTQSEHSLLEMCRLLYNNQPMSLLQSTLVEVPASDTGSVPGIGNQTLDLKGEAALNGLVKLCVPASEFGDIVNAEDEEDVSNRLGVMLHSAVFVTNPPLPHAAAQSVLVKTLAEEETTGLNMVAPNNVGVGQEPLLGPGLESKECDILGESDASQMILNDPILSECGEPLDGEETLEGSNEGRDIAIV
ncbi:cyclin-D-binding Myb-like transcription factor 1 isoform X2 [Oratosquilla oratoria]|uniref:cyclin-D-binding Myb-like transcription factor 1 isoform X2 n=1 Tax=Oratosquilla oratoria TaxID=337810 RepID=UPI003F758189